MAETAVKQLGNAAYELASQGLRTAAKAKVGLDRRGATPTAGRLLDVITRCLRGDFTAADWEWFDKAERQRHALLASTEQITKVDFGAGARNEHLSEAEMSAGAVKHTNVADVCRLTSKKPWWARLLYALIAEYRPANALELGTSVGISAAYQGGALLGHGGRLVTMEGAQEIAAIAQSTLDAVGLDDVVDIVVGRFGDALPPFLESTEPLDYVFVDGHHDEFATQAYHRMIKPYVSPGAVLIYDDIHWSSGMRRAWAAISADPDVSVAVDLTVNGIAVLGTDPKRTYRYLAIP